MAKYLDGIQQQDDSIIEFVTVASGTSITNGTQNPITTDIPRPSKIYRNYILTVSNKSGQTINSISAHGKTAAANIPIPNTSIGTYVTVKGTIALSIPTAQLGCLDLTSEEPNPFTVGAARFMFNLAASSTTGTIDWALIGY